MGGEKGTADRILVVEDDRDTRENMGDLLDLAGYKAELAASASEALSRLDWESYAAILLDRRLPDARFEELLPQLRTLAPDAAVIVVTGSSDLPGVVAALREGAADYILKPLDPELLKASLHRAVERRSLQLAKRRSETVFRTLVDAAEVLVVIARLDRTITYFGPFAEKLSGFVADEVIGRDICETILRREEATQVSERLQHLAAQGTIRGMEGTICARDGQTYSIVWNLRLLPDYEGEPAMLAVGHDITELKAAQERMLQAERLAAIGQMVAGLAHESRNALQRSQACLELLALKVNDRPELTDLIRRTQAANDHLHHLYEDVRGYAAPIKLDRCPVELSVIWREAWSHLEPMRIGRTANLVEEKEGVDLVCQVDPFRMNQVFRNVMENALHACKDPVELVLRCTPAFLAGRPAIRVSIQDNGPGLTPEQARRIFEPFYTTKTKGTGLGMAISRRIVEAHGGVLNVGETRGQGAEIVLLLPSNELSVP